MSFDEIKFQLKVMEIIRATKKLKKLLVELDNYIITENVLKILGNK